jgi:ketohexokinase
VQANASSTIGAGDTFIAGMLYGLHIEALSREARLEFAVGLATKKIQREGFAGLVHTSTLKPATSF